MTEQEALQQAAAEILKKEQQEMAKKEFANSIDKETTNLVNTQREKKLKDLQEQQEAHIRIYKKEDYFLANEIINILGDKQKESIEKSSLENVMNKIAVSNKEDEIRASFTDEASFNVFNRGVKEVGSEVFMEAYEKAGNNVFQALADVNGCKDIFELGARDRMKNEELMKVLKPEGSEMIERIAQRVAEILKQNN